LNAYDEYYHSYITPLIDMNLLEQVFTQKLDEIKKIIPDIDVAMNKVKDSFHLMRKNFSKYY
jgi:hypothetical protein